MATLRVLSGRHLRRLYLARFQSELGSGAAYVALVLLAYQRLHSGWGVALVLLADFLPGIALSAPFGALADRLPRRPLVVSADLVRAGAFVGLALIPSFAATIGFALAAGVGSALFRPTLNAALGGIVPEEQRSPATALYGAIGSFGMTAGPALTALVLLFGSPAAVLLANAATFLLSAGLLCTVPLGRGAGAEVKQSVWSATTAGARAISRIPGVGALLLIGAMSILAGALMNVAEPLLATGPLHAGNSGYSLLVSMYGAGMIAGSLLSAGAGGCVGGLRRRWLLGIALTGAGMLGSALAPSMQWALCTFALTGFSNGLTAAPEVRLVQELVRRRLWGRAFGLRDMLGNVAFVLAFVLAGVLLSLLGVRSLFALGGGAMLAVTLLAMVSFRPDEHQSEPQAVPQGSVLGT